MCGMHEGVICPTVHFTIEIIYSFIETVSLDAFVKSEG
jgi:hypothetical protein